MFTLIVGSSECLLTCGRRLRRLHRFFPAFPDHDIAMRDTWCRSCIAQRYQEATVNEGAWPVTCCQTEIAMDKVRHLLPLDLRTRFASKSVEYSDTDRIYCHEPSCSTYIPHSTTTENLARCPVCGRETCAQCKGPYHIQQLCPDDTTGCELLAETARANGWPKCPGCRRYVELTRGCNHIT